MNWYEKLSQYFPVEEMKSKEHMELLLKDKGSVYKKDDSPLHVLMYVEMEDFTFIDYLFVSKKARGQGLGKKLLNKLKEKEKPIILEVEPVDYDDTDTEKRQRFYRREGFKHAKSIGYSRRSLDTGKVNEMEILYWSPTDESEESIYQKMCHTYENIHTYKDEELYGESYDTVEKVLTYEEVAKKEPTS
ncbi:GNAT family N-acetyltransferase [Salipaludibacillus keqinensis]|uniref:GNAT family N-acetyltransferase n=1 Tax=Salipaludibacillus keqinensis TaxID=2045207 RepID=A0A323TDL5_9BACI|nr:GNAT family N-acetyltransferase [Salipaludibacillus keqinensis]PYZ93502.1 GNAT family N-acetyltransferase [Salipaludibacillus keqinensis]